MTVKNAQTGELTRIDAVDRRRRRLPVFKLSSVTASVSSDKPGLKELFMKAS